jgi:hypothetical protein
VGRLLGNDDGRIRPDELQEEQHQERNDQTGNPPQDVRLFAGEDGIQFCGSFRH